jgi:hypothetical protein
MKTQTPFKLLVLRAFLRKVSPMVIRVLAVPDYSTLAKFDGLVFCTLLGWDGFGFSFHIHGQEFISFLRKTKTHRWSRVPGILRSPLHNLDLCRQTRRVRVAHECAEEISHLLICLFLCCQMTHL